MAYESRLGHTPRDLREARVGLVDIPLIGLKGSAGLLRIHQAAHTWVASIVQRL